MVERSDEPYRITWVDRLVGLFVVGALVLVGLGVVLRYQQIGPGPKTTAYHTRVDRAYGIVRGADVRVSGIPIGRIDSVVLEKGGGVRIDFSVARRFRSFVTVGSRLKVGSSIGIGALIGGTGLYLVPGEGEDLLPAGAYIETLTPAELTETFSDVELEKMARNIKELLENLRAISEAVKGNQDTIAESVTQVNRITTELHGAVAALPPMMGAVETGFAAWERAGEDVSRVVAGSGAEIESAAINSRRAAEQFRRTLGALEDLVAGLDTLVATVQPGAERLPLLLADAHALVTSLTELTRKLERHWLFAVGAGRTGRPPVPPSLHMLSEPPASTPGPAR
jgi:ABC-type transporter Mla subunit MlaD